MVGFGQTNILLRSLIFISMKTKLSSSISQKLQVKNQSFNFSFYLLEKNNYIFFNTFSKFFSFHEVICIKFIFLQNKSLQKRKKNCGYRYQLNLLFSCWGPSISINFILPIGAENSVTNQIITVHVRIPWHRWFLESTTNHKAYLTLANVEFINRTKIIENFNNWEPHNSISASFVLFGPVVCEKSLKSIKFTDDGHKEMTYLIFVTGELKIYLNSKTFLFIF